MATSGSHGTAGLIPRRQTYAGQIRADQHMPGETTVTHGLLIIRIGQRAARDLERTLPVGAEGGNEMVSTRYLAPERCAIAPRSDAVLCR